MTKEEKELLLKDLCARLPYGVIVNTYKGNGHVCDIDLNIFGTDVGVNINPTVRDNFSINDVKPYLFPVSSMTAEQKREYVHIVATYSTIEYSQIMHMTIEDWFNKNHLDYRGLIPMGIALDATNKNIY